MKVGKSLKQNQSKGKKPNNRLAVYQNTEHA